MQHLPSRYIPCDGSLTASAYFNPRSPHGERLFTRLQTLPYGISIHAPRMGSDCPLTVFWSVAIISIHAPRMGSDFVLACAISASSISIHAPRMGSDFAGYVDNPVMPIFQSTLPAWGATLIANSIYTFPLYFNPRSPHGERRAHRVHRASESDFNPRSPHGERRSRSYIFVGSTNFNPRSPHGERHTSREAKIVLKNFNPRSPHGERQYSQSIQQ